MKLVLLFVILTLFLQQGAVADTSEDSYEDDIFIDEVGDAFPANVHSIASSISVNFINGMQNDSLNLFWVSESGENIFIADIPPDTSIPITTYTSHIFSAKPVNSQGMVLFPRLHIIRSEQEDYKFSSSIDGNLEFEPSRQTERPFIRLLHSRSTSASAKFRNIIPTKVDVWYDDGKDGVPQGTLDLGNEYTVNSYAGHVFFFTEHNQKSKVLARHTVKSDQVLYIIEDKSRPPPPTMREHIDREEKFMDEYVRKNGIQWRHFFGSDGLPRAPPQQFMWSADHIGQKHIVESTEHYWTCRGEESRCHVKRDNSLLMNLTVVSTHPRAFFIENFLSDTEVDAIIETAAPKMAGSYVGNKDGGGARKSDTRTSRNAWVGRESNEITESLFRRAEHLLKIPRLDRGNTEDMQVVHYVRGQKYDSHHDWGVSGYPESRFITLLLYLTDMPSQDAGGETAFPKGANGEGFKIHPGKGNAVLFYNLLPDGNGDDLSLHAALPVLKGEKWLANFWVWDPKRR